MRTPRPPRRVNNLPALKIRRRQLRSSPTPAEARLWKGLRRANLEGRKFRRQHSVGPYILDFYCPECRLAVELDGQTHYDSMASEYDLRRVRYLESLNIRVLRFENRAVFDNPEGVLHQIREHLVRPESSGPEET
ncbi:MAG TPA: endonuclease domain-containing protein [Terriglobia bacterium]|nr:endonuclease domain-containing protein [Terriglobia bacterium]